jgi:hypothetical protein
MIMRASSIFGVIALAMGLGTTAASAETREYRWCARYDAWSYNCGFVTFRQCMATVSGAGGICQPNPRAVAADPRSLDDRRKSRGY